MYDPLFRACHSFFLLDPLERGVTWKERKEFMYRVSSYFLAKTVVEIGLVTPLPFVFICIVYWMAGLKDEYVDFSEFFLLTFCFSAVAFGIFIGIVLLTGYIYQSLAIVIGGFVPQFQRGAPILCPYI